MTRTKISIITSTFNRSEDFLPECIKSVAENGYKSYEHIIIDDCSTDNTERVVKSLSIQYPNIKYYKTKKNFGSDTRPKNIGIKKARGEFIIFLDDDVALRKGAIAKLNREIRKGYDVVYGDMWMMPADEAGIAMDFDLQFLSIRNFIDTSSAIIRKRCLEYIGGWDETLPRFVDWNLFIRLAKAGYSFKRLPEITFDYFVHTNNKSKRIPAQVYNHPKIGPTFVPTFDPVGCKVRLPYLGELRKPKVAIFTIHYDRIEYSKKTYEEMTETAGYEFDWFCIDNGEDNTWDWLKDKTTYAKRNPENEGLSKSSNDLIDVIKSEDYDIIIKIDNDVEFITYGWLKDIVEIWERNHLVYISPYVEGLLHNPGGAIRVGRALIGDKLVEVTKHIGGIFAAIDAKAYDLFRWKDKMLHGYQDLEASDYFTKHGYMPCYFPNHIIKHRDTTIGQQNKYSDYFERRKMEKRTNAHP